MNKMNNELTVGIIGQGYWGPKLTRNFVDLLGFDHVSIADFRKDRLDDVIKYYPEITAVKNGDELFEGDTDALVIATPVHTHFTLAKIALLAGKHVLVEKPLTSHTLQAQELVALAKSKGLTLMVGHTYVYNPAVEALRKIIESGELGKIFYINSLRVNLGLLQPDINVMWDLAPHDLSILCYVLDETPSKVKVIGGNFINHTSNKSEVVFMNLRFPSGVLVNIRLSWLDPVKQRKMAVVGSREMLVYDDIAEDKIVIYDKGVEVPPYSMTMNEFKVSYRHGSEEIYNYEWVEPLRSECEQFINCIKNKTGSRSDGEDGLTIVRILEAAQRSLDNGGVELNVEY